MKAAVYMGPEHVEVKEVPTPEPGPGEILLRVEACAVCGTDVRIYWHGQKNVQPSRDAHEAQSPFSGRAIDGSIILKAASALALVNPSKTFPSSHASLSAANRKR